MSYKVDKSGIAGFSVPYQTSWVFNWGMNNGPWPVLISLLTLAVTEAGASPHDREKWIVGTWLASAPHRPDREVVFHADHSWGVRHYVPDGETIAGRTWRLTGDRLILTFPGDRGTSSAAYKILSFTQDKIVTDVGFTYTREE